MAEPALLTDAQVQQFICNGFLTLRPTLDDAVHRDIEARLRWVDEREFAMGNNVLARVPEMYQVLESAEVHGALQSLLGRGYLLHPHRAVHTSTPVEDPDQEIPIDADGPRMGRGSMAGSGWHQDAQSPLSRARHHVPRYLIGFYFPHDTPRLMGPTRLQAGSHLYAHPVAPDHVILPERVEAGTFFLLHFDIVHAAFPNRTNETRHMVKFVFARTEEPAAPSWAAESVEFATPPDLLADPQLEPAWRYVWDWLCGHRNSGSAQLDTTSLAALNSTDQPARLRAIYALAGCGANAVPALIDALCQSAGQGRDERLLATDGDGNRIPRDDRHQERRWTERAVVMDDAAYALGAIGAPAVDALTNLLGHEDAWIRINACFALGEAGRAARGSIGRIAELLTDPSQHVVRQALDAIGAIAVGVDPALPHIRRVLGTVNADWQHAEVMRGWRGQDQVRLNAVLALLNAIGARDADLALIEDVFVSALDDENGYVGVVAVEALSRIGTATAQRAALDYTKRRQWDASLRGGEKIY